MLPLPIDPQPPNSGWTTCPSPALLRSLDSGTLGASELESLHAHVAACHRCEQTLHGLAEESDSLIRTLASLPATDEDEPEFRHLYGPSEFAWRQRLATTTPKSAPIPGDLC